VKGFSPWATAPGSTGRSSPSPLVIAELGAQRLARGHADLASGHAGAVVGDAGGTVRGPAPLYLRQADVRIGWDQVDGRVGPVVPGAGAG
jgi:hypothetical protein